MALQKKIVIKWMLTMLWIAIGAGTVVLLVAAVRKKDAAHCKGVSINIIGVNNNFFVDKKDILDSIALIEGDDPVGKPVGSFNLKIMEAKLKNNIWVKNAQLFFDNNEWLQVKVTEREPVARIFTTTGNTFYIDSSIAMLPLSEKFSARLPVFTDFPSDKIVLSKDDSSLLKNIMALSIAIQKDTFCMALIDQIAITAKANFQFVPKLGNNIIEFGDASNATEKLKKIKLFYKNVMVRAGWNYYSVIDVQYKDQIVAKRKGADDKSADSLRTIQMMQQIAANAERMANDSLQQIAADNDRNTTDSSLIDQSMQRDENEDAPAVVEKTLIKESQPVIPFVPKPTVIKPAAPVAKPVDKKPVIVKPVATHPKPVVKPKPVSAPVKKPVAAKPVVTRPKPVDKKPKAAVQTAKPSTQKPVVKKKAAKANDNDY